MLCVLPIVQLNVAGVAYAWPSTLMYPEPVGFEVTVMILTELVTVMELLVADLDPSVTVIVCDGVVFNVKPVPVKVWKPLSWDVKVYLLPDVYGRTACASVELK